MLPIPCHNRRSDVGKAFTHDVCDMEWVGLPPLATWQRLPSGPALPFSPAAVLHWRACERTKGGWRTPAEIGPTHAALTLDLIRVMPA